MNFRKYRFHILLTIPTIVAIFFVFKTNALRNQLVKSQEKQKVLSKELHNYEELVRIDSVLLKGNYNSALNSYNETLKFQNENKLGIPVRIALAEKLAQVDQEKAQIVNLRNELIDTLKSVNTDQSNDINRLDSLNFILEKTKVQLTNLKRQLKTKSFGEYLKFTSKKGNQIHYVGQVKNGEANGFGIALLDTGSRYEGQWIKNERHGEGTFHWTDGEYYKGTYVEDKRKGFGTYYWPNGEKYVGEWNEDKRSGSGKFYGADGNVVTSGEWQDDKLIEIDKKGNVRNR